MKTARVKLKQTPPAPARGKSAGRNAQVVVEESHGGIGGRGRSSPPDKPQINWTAARVARLGKESDTSLARSLGVRMVVVRRKRLELGVPKYRKVDWTPELIAKLGQDEDYRNARLLGVCINTVRSARRTLGIPGYRRVTKPVYLKEDWTPEMIAKLGQDTDAGVARDLGVGWKAVFAARHVLGIPTGADSKWTVEALAMLGNRSDGCVAKELGVTRQAVHGKRTRLGIPPAFPH